MTFVCGCCTLALDGGRLLVVIGFIESVLEGRRVVGGVFFAGFSIGSFRVEGLVAVVG